MDVDHNLEFRAVHHIKFVKDAVLVDNKPVPYTSFTLAQLAASDS